MLIDLTATYESGSRQWYFQQTYIRKEAETQRVRCFRAPPCPVLFEVCIGLNLMPLVQMSAAPGHFEWSVPAGLPSGRHLHARVPSSLSARCPRQ